MSLTTWNIEIKSCMQIHGESFEDVESCTLTGEELDKKFDSDYGGVKGKPFTVWTKKRVYFPACYDGMEWCESVSRHPDGKHTEHV